MAIHADWLEWIFEQRTDVWIAERAGIPRSTIGFVRRGERDLPAMYRTALRSAYQSETTRRLSLLGMPHRESIRLSMVAPEGQRDIETRMGRIVSEFAINATTTAYEKSGLEWNEFDWNAVYDDYSEKIRDGIRRSPRSWDDMKEGFVS